MRPCCAASRDGAPGNDVPDAPGPNLGAPAAAVAASAVPVPPSEARRDAERRRLDARVPIPPGIFRMGTDAPTFPQDGEGPVRRVRLTGFAIDACAVTNLRFADFVRATGHVTDAERYGWSYVFHLYVDPDARVGASPPAAPWWRQAYDADWRRPFGGASGLDGRWDHPVVHVSWRDAAAFAAWAGGRLPTEAQWERAARGGPEQRTFPWGDALEPAGEHRCNVWQGEFPVRDDAEDGWSGTAPVDAFEANGFGLHNVVGNVWEWCADRFGVDHDPRPTTDPTGPDVGDARVMKGGSHLCHASYCNRYRVAARTSGNEDDGLGHLGFRVAYDG